MRAKLILLLFPLLLAFAGSSLAAQFTISVATGKGGVAAPALKKILVDAGANQTVTYTATDGYYLAEVKINKVVQPLQGRKTFVKEFTNVQANQSIAAKFLADPVITAKGSKGGTVTPSGKVFVPYSTSKSFSFAPQEGYHLDSVVADKVALGTPDSYTFDYVKTKHSLSVKFAINTYPVTTQWGEGGFISPAGFEAVKHGQTKTFTVKPNAGMRVASVTVNGTPVVGPLPPTGPFPLRLAITEETHIAATFAEIEISGAAKLQGTYKLVDDENGFWTDTGTNTIGEPISANLITTTFDGKGGCKVSVSGNSYTKQYLQNGSETVGIEPNGSPSSCSYSVGENGTFTMNVAGTGWSDTMNGWASTDGNVAIIGGYRQSSGPGWNEYAAETITGVKMGSGISKATAAGTYHLVNRDSALFKTNVQQDNKTHVYSLYGGNNIDITLDAAGGCSIHENGRDFRTHPDALGNEVVDIDSWTTLPGTTCSYTISSNGTFSLKIVDSDGTFNITGWSSADGNALVFGGAEQQTDTEGVAYVARHTFGIREGSNMNAANVTGTYQLVGSDFSFVKSLFDNKTHVTRALSGRHATATFDGAGGCTLAYDGKGFYTSYENNAWVVKSESDSGTMTACSYTIQPDGAFTLFLTGPGGNDEVSGRASADGSTILMGGPSTYVDEANRDHYEVSMMVGTKVK